MGRLGSSTASSALPSKVGVYGGKCGSEDVKIKKFSGRGLGYLHFQQTSDHLQPSVTVTQPGWPGSPGSNLNVIGRTKKPAPRKSGTVDDLQLAWIERTSAHQDETSPKSGLRKIRCQKPKHHAERDAKRRVGEIAHTAKQGP